MDRTDRPGKKPRQERKPAGNSRSRRIARRTFLAVCGTGAVAGVIGYRHLSVERPDLPLSMGKLPPDADPSIPVNPDCLKGFEDLGIRRLSELDRLPWFEKAEDSLFRLREDAGIGPIVDTHAHVGWAFVPPGPT